MYGTGIVKRTVRMYVMHVSRSIIYLRTKTFEREICLERFRRKRNRINGFDESFARVSYSIKTIFYTWKFTARLHGIDVRLFTLHTTMNKDEEKTRNPTQQIGLALGPDSRENIR